MAVKSRQKRAETPTQAPARPRGRPAKNSKQTRQNQEVPETDPNSGHPGDDQSNNDLASQQIAAEALALNQPANAAQRDKSMEDLVVLYNSADHALRVLMFEKAQNSSDETAAKLTHALSQPTHRLNTKFEFFSTVLKQEKEAFNSPGHFLEASHVQSGMPTDQENGLVEAIVFKINLAILSIQLRETYKSKKASEAFMKELDQVFPQPFVSSFSKDGRVSSSRLFDETFQVALQLRTLAAVQSLSKGDPNGKLRDFFYEESPEESVTLFHGAVKDDINNHDGAKSAIEDHISDVERVFSAGYGKKSGPAAKKFQWPPFVVPTLIWIQNRNQELTDNLHRLGFNTGDVAELDILLSGGIPGAGQTRSNPAPTSNPQYQMAAHGRGQRSMLDSQPNAQALEFEPFRTQGGFTQPNMEENLRELMQPVYNEVRGANMGPSTPGQKRKRAGSSSDYQPSMPNVTQDVGFDKDSTAVEPTSEPPKKKGRPVTKPVVSSHILTGEELEAQKQEYMAIGAAYQQFQTENKRGAKVGPSQEKGSVEVKARKRWTGIETGTLIHLVEQFGISWAQIKRYDEANGNLLVDRDQVNLKDKARNIKFDLLKARHPLPKNFELVTLSATMKQKLDLMDAEHAAQQMGAAQAAMQVAHDPAHHQPHHQAPGSEGNAHPQTPMQMGQYPPQYQAASNAAEFKPRPEDIPEVDEEDAFEPPPSA